MSRAPFLALAQHAGNATFFFGHIVCLGSVAVKKTSRVLRGGEDEACPSLFLLYSWQASSITETESTTNISFRSQFILYNLVCGQSVRDAYAGACLRSVRASSFLQNPKVGLVPRGANEIYIRPNKNCWYCRGLSDCLIRCAGRLQSVYCPLESAARQHPRVPIDRNAIT